MLCPVREISQNLIRHCFKRQCLIGKTVAGFQRSFAVTPSPQKKSSNLPEDQEEGYVDLENCEKLCKFACINYEVQADGPGPEIKCDSEYPQWLFQLDIEPSQELEDLDPENSGWKYWEKWEERRQQQMLRHDELKYKYFWLQHSPAIQTHMRFTIAKYKTHKFLTVPVTTPGIYLKHTRRRRLKERLWKSLEESEELMKENDGWGVGGIWRN